MDNPLISVIMSAYNERPEWLRASIESILGQTYRQIEFIIILDAPDNTVLEEVIREYAAGDSRIVFFKNSRERHGRVISLNRGLQAASGEYFAIMDADDISEPFRLELELRTLEDEGLDLVAGNYFPMSEDGAVDDGPDGRTHLPGGVAGSWPRLLRAYNIAPHPTWFARAETYRKVGPYHEIPRAEDYEWICRAALAGMRMRNLDEPVLRYRVRRGSISVDGAYAQERVADAVRREYCRARRRGRDMDEAALQKSIKGLSLSRSGARYMKAKADYIAAWETMREHRIRGLAAMFGVILRCPAVLRVSLRSARMRRAKRSSMRT